MEFFVTDILTPAQAALMVFGMGATLGVQDFINVVKAPAGLAVGTVFQLVVVPLIAYAAIEVFAMSPAWAVGLCLVAVVPGGSTSNLLTFLGRGNVALSISITTVTTVACIFTIPVLLGILASGYFPGEFAMPVDTIVIQLVLYVLIPLFLGMAVFRYANAQAASISKWAIRASIVVLLAITVLSLTLGRIKVAEYGWIPPLRIICFGVTLSLLVPNIVGLLRRPVGENVAISVEVVVRNISISLLLTNFLPAAYKREALYSALFYAGIALFLALPVMVLNRMGKRISFFGPRNTARNPLGSLGSDA